MAFKCKFSMIFIISVLLIGFVEVSKAESSDKKLVCYFGSWSYYRYGNGKFQIEDLDPNLCTHLIYTFLDLNADGSIRVTDEYLDVDLGFLVKFTALKKKNSNLKTIIAIGGWNAGSINFSKVSSDPILRAKFIQNALNFVKKYNFDGMDLDWEYPGNYRDAFSSLVKEMSAIFKANELLLTAAVAAAEGQASISYDIPVISQHLDFINVMTYDFHGSWETKIGHNSPLGSDSDGDPLLIRNAIKYWISQGAPRNKLILGIPLYGRTFMLADSSSTTPGSASWGAGVGGQYTGTPGMIGLNELCEKNLTEYWPEIWDSEAQVPYTYKNKDWISYENILSLQKKAEFALQNGLGGGMVWSIETDDFKNVCGNGKYVYLNAIKNVLNNNNVEPTIIPPLEPTTEPITTQTLEPTSEPTTASTSETITEPTTTPTVGLSTSPPLESTTVPTSEPTIAPTAEPSTSPPLEPTTTPTLETSTSPPLEPTTTPKLEPTIVPTSEPTTAPTSEPTTTPIPEPPTTPSLENSCKRTGLNKHPADSHKFISCVSKGDGTYIAYVFTCPANLIYNEYLKTCTWG